MAGALYLEAGHVPLPAGSPPPRLRAASRDALCWSKTSKNEASGPMGAKAMNTDVTETLQGPEPDLGPKGSARCPPCARSGTGPRTFPALSGRGTRLRTRTLHRSGSVFSRMRTAPPIGRSAHARRAPSAAYSPEGRGTKCCYTSPEAQSGKRRRRPGMLGMVIEMSLKWFCYFVVPWGCFLSFFFLLKENSRDFSSKQIVTAIQLNAR